MLLRPQTLTRAAFAQFGDVVESDGVDPITINQGFAEKFVGVASVDVSTGGGSPNVSLFVAKPRPPKIALMERHPLGSQMFFPLQDKAWLIVVCHDPGDPSSFKCFRATGQQGVNYARNAWHHPLIELTSDSRFLVVDRQGPGNNLEEVQLAAPLFLNI
jgi:ureidoglycolate lyase